MSDIRQWLDELDLGQYADAFEDNEIDLDLVRDLNDAALKDLGIAVMGQRLRLLRSIAALEKPPQKTTPATAKVEEPAPASREAERRQITVMFCDLVGSTALSEKLDPEDLRTLMQAYQKTAGAVIERYEGHVAQYLGDGLMTYFGWPRAHEDDAERAVRAGLDIVEAVKQVEAPSPLQVRIGIATGPVVVGETGAGDASVPKLAVGETPNLAARFQGLANADEIVVGHATRRLLGRVFDLENLGDQKLKGIPLPVPAWRVADIAASDGRFEARTRQLTPLVGRDDEMALVMAKWEKAKNGDGQAILLSGEPGIGKSRLTQHLSDTVRKEPHTRLRYQCSPYHINSALYPIIEQLERAAGFHRNDKQDQKLDKLEALLPASERIRALVASLLSLDAGRYPPLAMSPQQQKEETLQVLVEQALALVTETAVLLIFEDAHWIDPTSQELLDLLLPLIAGQRVLVVVTHRPEYEPPWLGQARVTPLLLQRLGSSEAARMIESVWQANLPSDILNQIIARTDGIPLFVEELTKAVAEGSETGIPETLQDSLMARLDRIGDAKEVAQIGACIGREVSKELLAAVMRPSNKALGAAFEKLGRSGLIHRGRDGFTFKHALIQDAAYESLLKSRRHEIHQKIAAALEKEFPEVVDGQPEIMAHHLTAATLYARALPYWLAAGRQAAARSANREAISQFRRGLALLPYVDDTPEKDQLELSLQAGLGPSLTAINGYRSPETIAAYERAYSLSLGLNETVERSAVLYGLWTIRNTGAEHESALALAAENRGFAKEQGDAVLQSVVGRSFGWTQIMCGQFVEATGSLERALSSFGEGYRLDLAARFVHEPKLIAEACLPMPLWILGFPSKAWHQVEEVMENARKTNHEFTLVWTIAMAGLIAATWLHRLDHTKRWASEVAERSDTGGFGFFVQFSKIFGSWADVALGSSHSTIELESAIDVIHQKDVWLFTPLFLCCLADSHRRCGRGELAIRSVDAALAFSQRTGERMMDAELHRIKGECLATTGDYPAAQHSYRLAIDIARAQHAKSWELRAATSLARLWQSQSKTQQAQDLLAPIYNWFTEGFDTSDLKEAKSLLEELKQA